MGKNNIKIKDILKVIIILVIALIFAFSIVIFAFNLSERIINQKESNEHRTLILIKN